MKGASASLARRRAISVLPTPVGPIIRMFLGVISWRSGSGTCWRRQRLLSAIATARLARAWPTTCLSSSETISRGVMFICIPWCAVYDRKSLFQGFDDVREVGVDAQFASDHQGFLYDLGRCQIGIFLHRLGGRLGIDAARSDRANAVFRLQHIAIA